MTSKERAEKRAQANNMEPLFQLGKGGMSDALIKQVDDALTARELIKVKVASRHFSAYSARGGGQDSRGNGQRGCGGYRRKYDILPLQQKASRK